MPITVELIKRGYYLDRQRRGLSWTEMRFFHMRQNSLSIAFIEMLLTSHGMEISQSVHYVLKRKLTTCYDDYSFYYAFDRQCDFCRFYDLSHTQAFQKKKWSPEKRQEWDALRAKLAGKQISANELLFAQRWLERFNESKK